jgi:hypothetical protein
MKHKIRELIFKSSTCRSQHLRRHHPLEPITSNVGSLLRQAALDHARKH